MKKSILANENVNIVQLNNELLPKYPSLLSARDLDKMKLPPIRWLIDDFLPEGLIILSGKPKEGKSVMGMNIALAVSQGGKVFSYFNANKFDVLYLPYEDNLRRLQSRIKKMKNIDRLDELPDNLYIPTDPTEFPKMDDNGIAILEYYIEQHENLKLIIIDTLGRAMDPKVFSKGQSYNTEYDYLAKLQKIAMKYQLAILLIHHTRKMGAEDKQDEVSGTTGITGAADATMVLYRKNSQYILNRRGRDVDEKEFRFKQEEQSLSWVIEGENQEIVLTEERQEIYDLLTEHHTLKAGEIAKAVGKKLSTISNHLRKLTDEGLIFPTKFGVYSIERKDKPSESDESGESLLKLNEIDENSAMFD